MKNVSLNVAFNSGKLSKVQSLLVSYKNTLGVYLLLIIHVCLNKFIMKTSVCKKYLMCNRVAYKHGKIKKTCLQRH